MQRRRFLTLLTALPATGFIRARQGAAESLDINLQESPVAGFQYHRGERLWPRLQEGDALELVREPGNRYDKRAVAVYWDRQKLGYVPRMENVAVTHMLDRGEPLQARITALRMSQNPWERVRFVVSLRPGARRNPCKQS